MAGKRVGILIFPQVEVLDFCGPFEVFSVTRLDEAARRETPSPFEVRLVAETSGPADAPPAADPERPHYGLIGMRERAAALGGDFAAGPTPDGWRVSCRLPLKVNDEPPVREVRSP